MAACAFSHQLLLRKEVPLLDARSLGEYRQSAANTSKRLSRERGRRASCGAQVAVYSEERPPREGRTQRNFVEAGRNVHARFHSKESTAKNPHSVRYHSLIAVRG